MLTRLYCVWLLLTAKNLILATGKHTKVTGFYYNITDDIYGKAFKEATIDMIREI